MGKNPGISRLSLSVGQAIWTCFFLRSTFGTKGFPKKNLKVRFFYLFVWRGGGSSHSKIFHSFGDFTIVGERLQKFHLCSAVMAIEQWGFFNVSHLLWHGLTVYNGHLRGPLTLTPIAKHWAEKLVLPVLTTWSVTTGDRTPNPACEANALPLIHCGGLKVGMSSSKCIWYSDMTTICYISV